MYKKYVSAADRKLNTIIIICCAAVILATVASVIVKLLPSQDSEQPGQNDLGVIIDGSDFPSSEPENIPLVSDADLPEQTTTTESTTTTTTTTAPPETNSAYDVTIKDSQAVRDALTQMMSAQDLALLDNVIATGSSTASASSSESVYDANGQLCIVDSEMQAVKYEYYIPGAGERVILVCGADGKVYVGLVTGNSMLYYTNDIARIQNAPKCISGYASALSLSMQYMSAAA